MIKLTMIEQTEETVVITEEMSDIWAMVAPHLLPGTQANFHAEDMDTGEVLLMFQEGEIKHMEPSALTGFLDMVFEVDPLLAMTMALDLLDALSE